MTSTTCGTRSDVKASLPPHRRGRVAENDQYAAFARRVIAAYSRRVAAGDIDAISDMTSIAAELDDAITEAVTGLRTAGYSWTGIAARLGITRQAAQQRWGRAWHRQMRAPALPSPGDRQPDLARRPRHRAAASAPPENVGAVA